jgi:hypothetical protein
VDSLNSIAPREPRLDEFASARIGAKLEDLSRVSQAQPYHSNGPVLDTRTVQLFESIADSGAVGRFQRGGKKYEIAELSASGYTNEKGQLTSSGKAFATPWREFEFGLSIAAQREEMNTGMQIWAGGGLAILAAGPSPFAAETMGIAPNQLALDLVTVAQLPMAIASWCSIGPAWTTHGDLRSLQQKQFYARLASAAEPAPADADGAWLRMWHQPWTAWNIRRSGSQSGHSWLNAGSAGHYRVGTKAGDITLEPEPSAVVWDTLVRFIHQAVTAPEQAVDGMGQ